jgi:hypothetical protein
LLLFDPRSPLTGASRHRAKSSSRRLDRRVVHLLFVDIAKPTEYPVPENAEGEEP